MGLSHHVAQEVDPVPAPAVGQPREFGKTGGPTRTGPYLVGASPSRRASDMVFAGTSSIVRWNHHLCARTALLVVLGAGAHFSGGELEAQENVRPAGDQKLVSTIGPVPIDTFTLGNGLQVMVSVDRSSPLVAVSMWYRVGSAHEEMGRTGLAHLFEHLLFQGTEHLPDGALDRLVTRAGGLYNATTGPDRTAYYEVLPSNRLNLALWLHAERMARLRITEEAFETQRQVVEEERLLRIENQPYGLARVAVDTLSQDYGPYRHPTHGSTADLDAARVEDARTFYERHYVPANAVLSIVGDVDVEDTRVMVERYLGSIDRGAPPQPLPTPPATPRDGPGRRASLSDPFAQLPLIWIAYTIPPADHVDRPAIELLSTILSGGESSRLRDRLVDAEGAALEVVSQMDLRVGPGTLRVGAIPNEGVAVERVEAFMEEEVGRVREEGVTDLELTKAVNARRAALIRQLMTVQSKAEALQWHALHQGSPHRINDEMDRYLAVTLADVRRAAQTYLTAANRTVVIARPVPAGGGDP